MMRTIALLGIIALLASIIGCGEEDPIGPGPTVSAPTNLTMTVGAVDDTTLQLSWTAPAVAGPADIDGYIIYFESVEIGSVSSAQTQYLDTPTSLGNYSVRAYKGSDKSDPISKSTVLITASNQGPIYWYPSTNESGYGWGIDGSGSIYSVTQANKQHIDILLDAFNPPNLISPADFESLDATWHETGISDPDLSPLYDDMYVAPDAGDYWSFQEVRDGGVYALYLQSGHYLKMEITEWNPGMDPSIRFKYGFQTVAGFRRLG